MFGQQPVGLLVHSTRFVICARNYDHEAQLRENFPLSTLRDSIGFGTSNWHERGSLRLLFKRATAASARR